MITEVRIRFAGNHVPGGAQAILGPARCEDAATVEDVPVLRQVEVWLTLEENDPRLAVVLQLLEQHGVSWIQIHKDRYSEEELDAARLLVMHPNRECQISGGIGWGTTYELDEACAACGTGARQTSALFVDGEEVSALEGHRAGATVFFHILVDEGLAADLENAGVNGLSFRSVYAVMPDRRQIKLRWRQMCAADVLPPMSPRTMGLERDRVCQVCRRNGHFQMDTVPTRIVYRSSALRDARDVNVSWENLGFAVLKPDLRESLLSYPWTLVTPKVRRVFRDAGVTSFEWLPVRVEEDEG